MSKFEIDKQLRTSKDKYQLPAKLWDSTLYDVIDDIHLVIESNGITLVKSSGIIGKHPLKVGCDSLLAESR